jgi:hypothetical protein
MPGDSAPHAIDTLALDFYNQPWNPRTFIPRSQPVAKKKQGPSKSAASHRQSHGGGSGRDGAGPGHPGRGGWVLPEGCRGRG